MGPEERLDVGVIGVGSMGRHHARVYDSLPAANLVGVYDVDEDRAEAVAAEHGTSAMDFDRLLATVDAASIAVPTESHYEVTTECLDAGVATLVEKPLVEDLDRGRKLQAKAEDADVPVQVGHVERFNPAVMTLGDLLDDLSIISVRSHRLGPPPDRRIDDSAVFDLMIHDVDVVLSLLEEDPVAIKSVGVEENRHASSLLEFESGAMASLTASRMTQRKVRTLEVTATEALIELDYIDQSIEIHRHSVPEYVTENGDVRFTHESIVERPRVPSEEPLRNELASFLEAVASNEAPEVTIEDALTALEVVQTIEEQGTRTADRSAIGVETRSVHD